MESEHAGLVAYLTARRDRLKDSLSLDWHADTLEEIKQEIADLEREIELNTPKKTENNS